MTNSNPDSQGQAKTYGHFDDVANAYVITDPKTPYPWINYLGSQDFFGMISNSGGGYCFYRDAKFRRLTRYRYNNVPVDQGGRYFYIKDGDHIWSPTWRPVQTQLDAYRCEHGLGFTRITGESRDLEVSCLFFVPLQSTCEIHQITVRNKSQSKKSVQLFSFAEWCLWNAQDDMSNFQRNYSTGEVQVQGSMLMHTTEYRERRDHFAFYAVNRPIQGFDTDMASFVGPYQGLALPQRVVQGACGQSVAQGWSPMASHQCDIELKPGEETDLIFVLGYVENAQKKWVQKNKINLKRAERLMRKYDDVAKVKRAFSKLEKHWKKLRHQLTLKSPDEQLNRLVNVWNPYQCVVTFNLARSASLFESGISRGIGFRDSNQDQLGAVHMLPDRSRQRILDLAATQYADGSADHQYQPLTKQGNRDIGSGFNDDPLWLIVSTAAYVKETGDWGILDELVPFCDQSSSSTTLFDHLKASFHHVLNHLGPHGLPLIGRADWNDCLNLNCFSTNPDESFQTTSIETEGVAESVMIAGLFAWCGEDYVQICDHTKRTREAKLARAALQGMRQTVLDHAWDGRWFLRAYDHSGKKVGSCENQQGQIFVESQAWCVMAGIGAQDGKAELAMDSVKAFLECDHGVVVLYPAYSGYDLSLGEISSYPQGYKENGAVFCHTNPWVIIAETLLGRGNRAFELLQKFSPPWREELSNRHKTEPYVYAQMIAGKEAQVPGEAKNSWLTGTASWAFYATSQYILGIRPEWHGLRLDPCIPQEWKSFQVTREFRGATYQITINNPSHVCKGVTQVTVNGRQQDGNLIPVFEPGSVNRVQVTLGRIDGGHG